jgi:hypothetical protein
MALPPTVLDEPGVTPRGQLGEPTIGSFHSIACKFNRKWVGILRNRPAKGPGRPPLTPPPPALGQRPSVAPVQRAAVRALHHLQAAARRGQPGELDRLTSNPY